MRQRTLPLAAGIVAYRTAAELTQKHGSDAVGLEIGPVLLPHKGETAGKVRGLEPGLGPDFGAVIVGGVDELVGLGEADGELAGGFWVGAPPVVVAVVGPGAPPDEPAA